MNSRKAIEHFVEYPLFWTDLQEMPDDQKAALGVLSYAASETNALARIYVCCSHKIIEQDAIDAATSIQRFSILRTWSAKLFEAEEFLQFGGKKKLTNDRELLGLSKAALLAFEPIRNDPGYDIARQLRHEAANHYSFKAAKKNLKFVSDAANCKMFLHEMNGNSFYPMGEEIMFAGALNRRGSKFETMEDREKVLATWMDWTLLANNWLNTTFVKFMRCLVLERNGQKLGRKRSYWLPMEFVGTSKVAKMPVFLRKDREQ